ncbi:MAG TPA: DUF2207 domain-containing protein [Sphingomicrobium sp.]|nr:DUF2207 domain-containing protein [Sphingomicrobium sp.]
MNRALRGALAALLLALAWVAPAQAEERILSFLSDVAIQRDGSLLVTETITVRAEGDRIRRGIFREFPTRYKGRSGGQVRVGFEPLGVTRNGQPEPFKREAMSNGVRIRIGNPNVLLEPGEYRYGIRYRTTRQLGRFRDFDEVYWNVTGNGWAFPIERAEARITLPSPVQFGQRAFYTGPQGATGSQAEVISERPGEIAFATTAPLGPNEGFTIAAAFPKGVVGDASASDQRRWWLNDFGPLLAGTAALLAVIGFYFHAWRRAGRDPVAGTVVPLFSPSDNLSPAAMRYVWKMKADNRAFAAALVDLGVKGHVRLVEEEGGWLGGDKTRIERLAAAGQPIPAAEEAMLRELATSGESIVMEQENHPKFQAAQKALTEDFKKRFDDKLFHRNWGWAIAGSLIFLAGLWLTAAAVAAATDTIEPMKIGVGVGSLAVAALLGLLIAHASAVGKCLMVVVMMVCGAAALATGMPVFVAALESGWWLPIAIPALALPLALSAFWWMSAPTREGRAVLDRIAGFRQYLSIAEGERLDRMTAPRDTPEIFEKYLPYAIALGVENRWAERFEGVLAAAAAQGRQGFSWYSGSRDPWSNSSGFVRGVGSSLASTVSSASSAPGSSSGSGGGGSSGGGGGGGGGGGW